MRDDVSCSALVDHTVASLDQVTRDAPLAQGEASTLKLATGRDRRARSRPCLLTSRDGAYQPTRHIWRARRRAIRHEAIHVYHRGSFIDVASRSKPNTLRCRDHTSATRITSSHEDCRPAFVDDRASLDVVVNYMMLLCTVQF
ncbi:hypothetical protein PG994_011640 [Apiospora phragmitis]|uniref:Uncharacterized protein n=1 Tax=Apiospora phragmitis TaxID=2905665 RepID=A0ABR1TVL5_9PEZI